MSLRGTILLSSGVLNIAKDLTIRGPGAGILSISSGKSRYVVHVLQGVTVTISGLTFKDSKTSNGFIDNEGTLTLNNSTVSGNTSTGQLISGGGIYNNGTLMLSNSTVSGNTATGSLGGGGIYNDLGGTLTLSNSTVSGNTASSGNGGGIFNQLGPLTLSNSTVSGNTATGSLGGGGIFNGGPLTLSNSTVSGNTVTHGAGGGIFNQRSTLTLSNSTVSGNTASSDGGGIAISEYYPGTSVSVMLLYCTVYGNTAGVGGGIWIGNLSKKSQVTMGASIVAGDIAHTGPDITGRLASLGYNLVGDRSGATFLGSPKVQSMDMLGVPSTVLKIDPMLRDNGGRTKTYALLPGSPAIDAIPLQYCQVKDIFNSQSGMYTDQRGVKRPDENENKCDIGAYESSP